MLKGSLSPEQIDSLANKYDLKNNSSVNYKLFLESVNRCKNIGRKTLIIIIVNLLYAACNLFKHFQRENLTMTHRLMYTKTQSIWEH